LDNYLDRVKSQRQEELKDKEKHQLHKEQLNAIKKQTLDLVKATQNNEPKVTIKNTDLAKSSDILAVKNAVVDNTTQALLSVSTLNSIKSLVQDILKLSDTPTPETKIELHQEEVVKALDSLKNLLQAETKVNVSVDQDKETAKQLKEIKQLLKKLEVAPVVNVPKSSIKVESAPLDLSPITEAIDRLIDSLQNQEQTEIDLSEVVSALNAQSGQLSELIAKPFPVQEYPTTITTKDQSLRTELDDQSPIIYIGKAPIGSNITDPVWQIAKLDTSSGLSKTWAGSGFDQIWSDRGSLTYN
jgi:hypothetical protein